MCKGGTIEINTLAAVDLSLAIQGQVVSIFADQNMGHRRLGRHTARDQPCWGRSLHHAIGARAAGVFWATGHDDTELGGDDVQPFRHIFTDAMQTATTSAGQARGLNHLFNTR